MGEERLKKEIMKSLEGLSEKYLNVVHNLIQDLNEKDEESDWLEHLNVNQKSELKESIKRGEEDIFQRRLYSIDEVRDMIKK